MGWYHIPDVDTGYSSLELDEACGGLGTLQSDSHTRAYVSSYPVSNRVGKAQQVWIVTWQWYYQE